MKILYFIIITAISANLFAGPKIIARWDMAGISGSKIQGKGPSHLVAQLSKTGCTPNSNFLQFSGKKGAVVTIPHTPELALSQPFAIELKFSCDLSKIKNFANLIGKGLTYNQGYCVMLDTKGDILVNIKGLTPEYMRFRKISIPSKTPVTLRVEYDRKKVLVIVNGKIAGSRSVTGSIAQTKHHVYIGGFPKLYPFTGNIYSVIISEIHPKKVTSLIKQGKFTENFQNGISSLLRRGWQMPGNTASVVSDDILKRKVLLVKSNRTKEYITLLVPMNPDKTYRAEVYVKYKGKARTGSKKHGAVFYVEWAKADKGHISGGNFPLPFTNHQWRKVSIDCNPAGEKTRYYKIYLGLKGKGSAWYDRLSITEYSKKSKIKICSPGDNSRVDITRPLLKWSKPNKTNSSTNYKISLAQNAQLTSPLIIKTHELFCRPESSLAKGKWFWKVEVIQNGKIIANNDIHSFYVGNDAIVWPSGLQPVQQWSDKQQFKIKFSTLNPSAVKNIEVFCLKEKFIPLRDFTFQSPKALTRGTHLINVRVRGNNNKQENFSFYFSNRIPGSRVTIRSSDGVIIADGKPFFPVGTFRGDTPAAFGMLKNAGFNLVHSYTFEGGQGVGTGNSFISDLASARAYLDQAHKQGLKVFMGFNRKFFVDNDILSCERWVGELMNCPALLAWYLYDEPNSQSNFMSPYKLKNFYLRIKKIDPHHPVILLLVPSAQTHKLLQEYVNANCDIITYSNYPLPQKKLTRAEQVINDAFTMASIKNSKSIFQTLQGHDIVYYHRVLALLNEQNSKARKNMLKTKPPTCPNYQQTRYLTYSSIIAGADGVLWYWLPMRYWDIHLHSPVVWQGISRTLKELSALQAFLTQPATSSDKLNLPSPLRGWKRKLKTDTACIIVNSSQQAHKLSLPVGPGKLFEFVNGRKVPVAKKLNRGIVKDKIPPWGVKVYFTSASL